MGIAVVRPTMRRDVMSLKTGAFILFLLVVIPRGCECCSWRILVADLTLWGKDRAFTGGLSSPSNTPPDSGCIGEKMKPVREIYVVTALDCITSERGARVHNVNASSKLLHGSHFSCDTFTSSSHQSRDVVGSEAQAAVSKRIMELSHERSGLFLSKPIDLSVTRWSIYAVKQ